MYTFNSYTGEVTRDIDGVICSPVNDLTDPNFVEYNTWVASGNEPTYVNIPTIVHPTTITASEFRDRFTQAELMGILQAAYTGDPYCQLLLLKVQTANAGIVLNSPETVGGVRYLVNIGKITTERATEILG